MTPDATPDTRARAHAHDEAGDCDDESPGHTLTCDQLTELYAALATLDASLVEANTRANETGCELDGVRAELAEAKRHLQQPNFLLDDHLAADDIGETGDGGLFLEEDHAGWRRSVAFSPAAKATLERYVNAALAASLVEARRERDAATKALDALRVEAERERDEARASLAAATARADKAEEALRGADALGHLLASKVTDARASALRRAAEIARDHGDRGGRPSTSMMIADAIDLEASALPAAPATPAAVLRHSTKENGDCPAWCKACDAVRRRGRAAEEAAAPAAPAAVLPTSAICPRCQWERVAAQGDATKEGPR